MRHCLRCCAAALLRCSLMLSVGEKCLCVFIGDVRMIPSDKHDSQVLEVKAKYESGSGGAQLIVPTQRWLSLAA